MDAALRQLNDQLDLGTQCLLDAARVLPEPDLRVSSLLPGWSRADVLAHLARGADAMRGLLAGARAGQQRPVHTRARDREISAAQTPKDLMDDLAASAMALRTVIRQLPDQAWSFLLKIADAEPFPAAALVTRRLVEVELHHCDLGIGYDAARWPASFAEMPLPEPMHSQRQERLGYQPQSYQPTPARANQSAAAPGAAQQRAMILRSLSGGPGMA
ncbi:MAG: maleylpyruvate isomerase N-terminal domain-containing protein [Streptosporangiaceae bacterium]